MSVSIRTLTLTLICLISYFGLGLFVVYSEQVCLMQIEEYELWMLGYDDDIRNWNQAIPLMLGPWYKVPVQFSRWIYRYSSLPILTWFPGICDFEIEKMENKSITKQKKKEWLKPL